MTQFSMTSSVTSHINCIIVQLYHCKSGRNNDFSACDSVTLDSLHQTYCMHMYGVKLWNLNRYYVNKYIIIISEYENLEPGSQSSRKL